jgi:hypothetical protein
MVQIHCTTPQQIDAVWRLLSEVPDSAFVEAEVWLLGEFHYLVIRSPETGEQTTAQPADRPACTFPAA